MSRFLKKRLYQLLNASRVFSPNFTSLNNRIYAAEQLNRAFYIEKSKVDSCADYSPEWWVLERADYVDQPIKVAYEDLRKVAPKELKKQWALRNLVPILPVFRGNAFIMRKKYRLKRKMSDAKKVFTKEDFDWQSDD